MKTEETREIQVEARLRLIEDRLEIYNIVAAHPPIIDTGSGEYIGNFWAEDGEFDGRFHKRSGSAALATGVSGPGVKSATEAGLSHFPALPYVTVTGDTAHAISYLQLLGPDLERGVVDVPNHAPSKGYRVHMVLANRWDLVRTAEGWRIKRRTMRYIDGSEEARVVLRSAFETLTPAG